MECTSLTTVWYHNRVPTYCLLVLSGVIILICNQIKAAIFNEEPDPQYSVRLLNNIKKVDAYFVEPVPYASLESAIAAVDKGYATAAVHFHKDYTEALDRRIADAQDDDIDNETLSRSSLHLWLDNTNFLYANGLIDSLRMTLYETVGDIFIENNMSRIDAPLKVVETIYAENSKLSDFLLPGYLISFMYLSQVLSILIIKGNMLKQGFKEVYSQRLKEGNIVRLKLSKLRPHRLRLSRSEAGVGVKMKLYTPFFES